MRQFLKIANGLMEKGMIPDPIIRFGIRGLLRDKLREEQLRDKREGTCRNEVFVSFLKASPIAVNTQEANEQHYEMPAEFFQMILGPHMKYSSGIWPEGVTDLGESEEQMLELTTSRAQLEDGQRILELGCGWGSLTLFMAAKFPRSRIVGVSNSASQRKFILQQAKVRGLENIDIITADMNNFIIEETFDRIVSVEMFEHMRNYQLLLEKLSGFLIPGGKLFVHIFTHRDYAYLYKETDESDWIARYFFTGGIMPSDNLLHSFQDHFQMEEHWQVSGVHYQKTSEAWLANMDRNRQRIMPILNDVYGVDASQKWWSYWRVFFMSCAELWGYQNGTQWIVSHYRMVRKG